MKTLLVLMVAIFSLGITSAASAENDPSISNNGYGLTTTDGRCPTCRSHTLPHLRALDNTLPHSGGGLLLGVTTGRF